MAAQLTPVPDPALGALIGYARVSTVDQDEAAQVAALNAAGCIRVFAERASGASTTRPQLEACLDFLRAGDTLTVWKLDRLGRSLAHLIQVVTTLAERGVGFRSLTEGIDTTTAGGQLIFHVMGALAEFERALIRERTLAGLQHARSQGRIGGRPRALGEDAVKRAQQLREAGGLSMEEIARAVGCSRTTLYRTLGVSQ